MKAVDADKLAEKAIVVQNYIHPELGFFIFPIDAAKTLKIIDVVDVVRCKDCKHKPTCKHTRALGINGYCSDAERRNDGEIH